jgi:predicted MFS family arabinose efflux permease
MVLGVLTAASATGQLIFLPLLAWIAGAHGWRSVAIVVAIAAISVIPIIVLFLREQPSDVGLERYGAKPGEHFLPPTPPRDPVRSALGTLRTASSSVDFWLLAGTFFICGASTNGLIGIHLIPAAVDHGMAEVTAASLLALVGIFDVIGTTASGWLTDRWDPRKLLATYYALRGLSLLYLPIALNQPNAGLVLFIVFYGLDWVATVPPTATLATSAFGRENGPVVYGWIFTAHQFGAAFSALAAGTVRSTFGDYLVAFVFAGGLCLAAAAMSIRIGKSGTSAIPAEWKPAIAD